MNHERKEKKEEANLNAFVILWNLSLCIMHGSLCLLPWLPFTGGGNGVGINENVVMLD